MNTLIQPSNRYESAKLYYSEGIQIVPTDRSKKPIVKYWKEYQLRPNTRNQIETWNKNNSPNLGGIGGRISNNLVFIDIDDVQGLKKLEREKIFQELRCNTRVSLSATRNLPHIWARTPYPVRSGKNSSFGYDIKGEGGYVLLPLSETIGKDEQLRMYQWENFAPIVTLNEEQIDFLGLEKFPEDRNFTYNLSPYAWKYIREGQPEILGKKSRSEADQHILVWCVGHAWTREQIQELIRTQYYFGNPFQEKGNQYFERSYQKAIEYVKLAQNKKLTLIQEAEKRIYSLNGNIDQKIFSVFLDYAKFQNKTNNVFLSCRDIALKAGVSTQTASRGLKRLQENKILKLNTPGTKFKPDIDNFDNGNYNVQTAKKLLSNTYDLLPNVLELPEGDKFDKSMISNDAFRRGGLGEKGLIVYLVIKDLEGGRQSDIILECKKKGVKSNKTVIEKIKALSTFGLIRFESKRYYANPILDLEDISKKLGIDGKGERDARMFELAREGMKLRVNSFV